MSTFVESGIWENAIEKLEVTDPVLAGDPNNPANIQAKQLANRTSFLKSLVDGAGVKTSAAISGNLNTVTNSGFYAVASGATNKPSGVGAAWMLVINDGGTQAVQILTAQAANEIYFRRIVTAGPQAWQKLQIDTGNAGNIAFLEARLKSLIAFEPAVITEGCIPFNINTGASTLQISAGFALIDGVFLTVPAYSGTYPVHLKNDGTWTVPAPGSGSFVRFDPQTSQNYKDVARRSAIQAGEVRLFAVDPVNFVGGLGRWEFKGFAICDGNNGTINMSGRVPVGQDGTDPDFNSIGEVGGAKSVSLVTANLPNPGDLSAFGLIRKSIAGQATTTADHDSNGSGTEPDTRNAPGNWPYAGAVGQPFSVVQPYRVLVYLQRI